MLLSQRIVLTVSIALLALSAGFLITQGVQNDRLKDHSATASIVAKQALWQNVAKVEINAMRTAIRTITRNRDALTALSKKQFEDLQDELAPTANRLSASKIADDVVVVTIEGRPVFPGLAKPGVRTKNPIILQALKQKKIVSGLVPYNGKPSFAIATPLYKGRDIIGATLLRKTLISASVAIADSAGVEVMIFEHGKNRVHTTNKKLGSTIIGTAGLMAEPTYFVATVEAGEKAGANPEGEAPTDLVYGAVSLPLKNATGGIVGFLVTIEDISALTMAENAFAWKTYIALAAIFVICLVGLMVFLRRSFKPLNLVTDRIKSLSEGNTDIEVPTNLRKDEIGAIWRSVGIFRDNMIANSILEAEKKESDNKAQADQNRRADEEREAARLESEAETRRAEEEREALRQEAEAERLEAEAKNLRAEEERQALRLESEAQEGAAEEERQRADHKDKLIAGFDAEITRVLQAVAVAAGDMRATAETMSQSAEQANAQSSSASAASEEASNNIQTVAAAAEQLSASVSEIGRQVTESARVATEAVAEATATNKRMQSLADTANTIGNVVSLISDIAAQTNLLALNATIEAARAGESGKGFAVVASEVKSLADQTAKATDDISGQIEAIQSGITEAVGAIENISSVIGRIDEISGTIASAVHEQGASTQEIAGHVQEAVTKTQDVTDNIALVDEAAGQTGQSAHRVLGASEKVSQQSDDLRKQVDQFLQEIQAA